MVNNNNYSALRERLSRAIEIEERKYPLTEREQLLVGILNDLLVILEHNGDEPMGVEEGETCSNCKNFHNSSKCIFCISLSEWEHK